MTHFQTIRKTLLIVACFIAVTAGAQQVSINAYVDLVAAGKMNDAITEGIRVKNAYQAANDNSNMFEMMRRMDRDIDKYEQSSGAKQTALYYRVQNERLNAFIGWRQYEQGAQAFAKLQKIAIDLDNDSLLQDWLNVSSSYFKQHGTVEQSTQCYKDFLNRRRAGKSLEETDKEFQAVIAIAEQNKMKETSQELGLIYKAWQDSVAVERLEEKIQTLQQSYDECQETLDDRDSTITTNRVLIGILVVVALGLAGALVFFVFLSMRYRVKTNRLKANLKFARESNEQKANFINQISNRLMPHIEAIAEKAGDKAKAPVEELRDLLTDVQAYATLEQKGEHEYEHETITVRTICEEVAKMVHETASCDVPLTIEAPAIRFTTSPEALRQVLTHIIISTNQQPGTQKIHLEFRKRGPHSGTFVITNFGGTLPEESRESLFVPFQGDAVPGDNTGLGYPICQLLANRLGGGLELDPEFSKGVRFLLKVEE